jgi:hypothetical protein
MLLSGQEAELSGPLEQPGCAALLHQFIGTSLIVRM